MFVILVGNPIDGMGLYGPFNDAGKANDYADANFKNETWWVVPVAKPHRG